MYICTYNNRIISNSFRPARASCSATAATAVRPANHRVWHCVRVALPHTRYLSTYCTQYHHGHIYIYLYTRLWVHNTIYHFLFIIFYDFYITSLYTRTHTPVLCHIIMYISIYTLSLSLRVSSSLICRMPYCCRRYYFCPDRHIIGIYLFYYGRLYI